MRSEQGNTGLEESLERLLADARRGQEAEERVDFALEALEEGWSFLPEEQRRQPAMRSVTFTCCEWEELRSSYEFALLILKGEVRRGQ